MIRTFRDRETEKVFHREGRTRFSRDVQRTGLRKLLLLHAACLLRDLRIPPGNRLEKLVDKRAGQYSIRINDQWRVCFHWSDNDAFDVEIVDYH